MTLHHSAEHLQQEEHHRHTDRTEGQNETMPFLLNGSCKRPKYKILYLTQTHALLILFLPCCTANILLSFFFLFPRAVVMSFNLRELFSPRFDDRHFVTSRTTRAVDIQQREKKTALFGLKKIKKEPRSAKAIKHSIHLRFQIHEQQQTRTTTNEWEKKRPDGLPGGGHVGSHPSR